MIPRRIRERLRRLNPETLLLKIQGKIRNLLLQMNPLRIPETSLYRIHQMILYPIRSMILHRILLMILHPIRATILHPILRMILKMNSRKRGRYIPRISLRALSFCSS
jgi:hypothetical protein